MKKCPNCQKEFPDSMRFCQTDGTPLVAAVEASQSEDPLKTTVVRQEDIASAIPPSDPFKTMVAGSGGGSSRKDDDDDNDDLLQLPQEFDPMKTMVVTPLAQDKSEASKFEDIKDEIRLETPSSSPFGGGFSQPKEPLPEAPKDYSSDPTLLQPEPPRFDASSAKDEDDLPQTVMQNPWDKSPKAEQSPYSNDSPFSRPSESPMSSPFGQSNSPFDQPKSSTDEAQSPFGQTPSSFDALKDTGFNQPPQATFDNQPASFNQPKTSFDEPASNQFGSAQAQFDQMNQGFGSPNQQVQQSDWTPPPTPEQGWGEQGLGANTPFQPPVVGAGQSKTLAIISIVLGAIAVLSVLPTLLFIFCGVLPILFGLGAVITGFLARSRANQSPDQYGGGGLALGGLITGGLALLATIGLVIVTIAYFGYLLS